MIKRKDLETGLAQAEQIEGQYMVFVQSTQDQQAKSMWQSLAQDATQHVQKLRHSLDQMTYSQWVAKVEPKPPRVRNAIAAFAVGGLVCVIGQGVQDFWEAVLGISHQKAGDPTVATMVFFGALLTGLGYFDKMARFAGAGLAVPVTGFANAMAASALEFKKEGLIFGIGGRMFQLAGAVIVFGTATAFFVGLVAAGLRFLR